MNCPKCGTNLELRVAGGYSQPRLDISSVGDLLSAIDPQSLDEKSSTFVAETRERYEKYHDGIKMSPKQMQWLQNLASGVRF